MFGSHLSIAGGPHHALMAARRLKLDCLQIFTANQRQWSPPAPTDELVEQWHAERRRTPIPVASHDSYLINFASPRREVREKSIRLFVDELARCEALGIGHVVAHPGAHLGIGAARGLDRVVGALDRIHKRRVDCPVVTCLEITAGQGTTLGVTLGELRAILDAVAEPGRLAVCVDTAHALAAGYDLTSAAGAEDFVAQLDGTFGLDLVKVVHVNDSQTPLNSRRDRHEHVGLGHVALDAFGVICRAFPQTPKILETPKGTDPRGREWDKLNLKALRRLARARS
ncbi:MAG: deoxyribonuclease IV [Planctomycetes bacterium]|jgi:deoxyribonuclease-4|nr:deoxyribonuclease IV [Planctomycetota bacterium]